MHFAFYGFLRQSHGGAPDGMCHEKEEGYVIYEVVYTIRYSATPKRADYSPALRQDLRSQSASWRPPEPLPTTMPAELNVGKS